MKTFEKARDGGSDVSGPMSYPEFLVFSTGLGSLLLSSLLSTDTYCILGRAEVVTGQ